MCDKNWAARIKVEKFRSHNQQWLEMVESIGADSTTHLLPDDDDSLSPFISGDLLKHTILFPSGNINIFFMARSCTIVYHVIYTLKKFSFLHR